MAGILIFGCGEAFYGFRGDWIKKNASTATSWGLGGAYGIGKQTVCKAAYQFRMSLRNNDNV